MTPLIRVGRYLERHVLRRPDMMPARALRGFAAAVLSNLTTYDQLEPHEARLVRAAAAQLRVDNVWNALRAKAARGAGGSR